MFQYIQAGDYRETALGKRHRFGCALLIVKNMTKAATFSVRACRCQCSLRGIEANHHCPMPDHFFADQAATAAHFEYLLLRHGPTPKYFVNTCGDIIATIACNLLEYAGLIPPIIRGKDLFL